MIDSTRIIEVTNKLFIVKFDLEEKEKLAKDLNNLFFIKRVGERRVKKKKRTWLCDGELICYLLNNEIVLKWNYQCQLKNRIYKSNKSEVYNI